MSFIDELENLSKVIPLESTYVKEWKRKVFWAQLSANEVASVNKRVAADENPSYAAEIIILKALDESGARLFANSDTERLKQVKYQLTLNELAIAMQRRITEEAAEDFSLTTQAN